MLDFLIAEHAAYALAAIFILAIVSRMFKLSSNIRHRSKRRAAKRVFRIVSQFDDAGAVMSYVRKIDPFVFEELVLDSLKRRGHRIKRNHRYTGDGGVDGAFFISGHKVLIQAKRYSSHINAKHVSEFSQVCKQSSQYGLFVHTGRTGPASHAKHYDNIMMLSGEQLTTIIQNSGPVRLALNSSYFVDL